MNASARTQRSVFAEWTWGVDRVALAAILALVAAGLLLSLAASPAAANRPAAEPFYYLNRHGVFAAICVATMLAVSTLNVRGARRLAVLALAGSIVLMAVTVVVGHEVNGSRRWLRFAGLSLQASEFAKPAFVVTAAWLLAEGRRRDGPPGAMLAGGLFVLIAALLMLQPDFGQTALLTVAFGWLVFLSGVSWRWLTGFAAAGGAIFAIAYANLAHVADRIDRFLNPISSDTYQIDRALEAIGRGGLLGVGPGEGEVKHVLPDAHTDFIFAVAAEEYGLIFGFILVGLFALLAVRTFARSARLNDPTARLAAVGLAVLIALQAFLNIGVNLGVLPQTGMTLPFVSYGGSSLVALGLTAGLLLAFTRRRPGASAPR